MSYINHDKKYIFVHIAKCAGSSISKCLDGRRLYEIENGVRIRFGSDHMKAWKAENPHINNPVQGHKTITDYYKDKKILKNPDINLDDYFKWTFVRNPWARIVSGYFNSLKQGGHPKRFKNYGSYDLYKDIKAPEFKEFIKILYNYVDEIAGITKMRAGYALGMMKPCVAPPLFDNKIPRLIHYMPALPCLTLNGECKIDFIGKVENLEEDWKYVSNIIGVTDEIGHVRKNTGYEQGSNYKDHYDDATVNMVGELFKQDIDHFGYSY